MPKKRNKAKPKKQNLNYNKKILNKIKKEIVNKINIKKVYPKKEKNKKDTEIKVNENNFDFENLDLNSNMNQTLTTLQNENRSPVLEEIADSQPKPIFVGNISQKPIKIPGEEKENDDKIKYLPNLNKQEEKKYEESSHIKTEIEPIDINKIERRNFEFNSWKVSEHFDLRENQMNGPSSTIENVEKVRQYDFEKARKETKKDIKYESHTQRKLPKSW